MSDYEMSMSLGVRHPDIDPAQITQELGLQPGHVWRKGEQRMDEHGAALSGTRHASYWLCELSQLPGSPGERTDVESELSRVLQMLRRSFVFLQGLQFSGGATELLVTIHARGDFRMELPAGDGALLGRLGIAMTLEIKPYPSMTVAAS
jgi:hypothetical protein